MERKVRRSNTRTRKPVGQQPADGVSSSPDAMHEEEPETAALPTAKVRESYRRAVRDVATGRVRRFPTVEALQRWLDE